MEDHGRWLDVQLPTRPNGTRAFVRRTDVVLRTVPNWIRVVLSTRRVTVFNGFTPLLETVGAVGRATSVTPTGWFYVDASVLLTDPTGPYGAGQLTLSGFSEVYTSFAGGDGPDRLARDERHGFDRSGGQQRLRPTRERSLPPGTGAGTDGHAGADRPLRSGSVDGHGAVDPAHG